jgi:hypothetical protein
MTERVMFNNTILKGINKGGVLNADEDGYYDMVLGALGVMNSAGELYVNSANARRTFEQNSTLMRRVSQGLLRGEWGHPDPADSPNFLAFESRVRKIKEDRISHHISKVWLEEIDYKGKKTLAILGKVKPCGPYGKALEESINNPQENVTFSGRYYSNVGTVGAIRQREIHTVATWDFVSEPGIECASKYASPSLEDRGGMMIDVARMQQAVALEARNVEASMSMESSGGYLAKDLMADLGFKPQTRTKHGYLEW